MFGRGMGTSEFEQHRRRNLAVVREVNDSRFPHRLAATEAPAAVSCAYIRMLVSTKNLSLMRLGPRRGRSPLKIKAFPESRERAFPCPIERLSLTDHGS